MQATITFNPNVFQNAKQPLQRTHFETAEDFMAFLIEERVQEMSSRKSDPILRLRGKLKGKIGGTALFMEDKQAEIDKEERVGAFN